MPITEEQATAAVTELAALMRYFPGDKAERGVIARVLTRMVADPKHLRWLVDALVNSAREWPGFGEVRGMYCTRYKPLDGIEANCSLPGFRPEDGEARSYDQHQQLKGGGWTDDGERMKELPMAESSLALVKSAVRRMK